MNNAQASTKDRFHFLDGLRAIASILVLIHHSLSSGITKYLHSINFSRLGDFIYFFTQSGVALFFVLSGVVLLRPYMRNQREFKALEYFYRRIKRIYPPYFVALIFGYLVIVLIKSGPHTYYSDIWKWSDTSLIAFLKQSIIVNFNSQYYNLAWWSLQIEVVFYILVPAFVFVFSFNKNYNIARISLVLLTTMIVSYSLQLFLSNNYPQFYSNNSVSLNVYRFIDYPICFILGIYLAKFDFDNYVGSAFSILGLILIFGSKTYVPLINSGYGFLYAGIIIFAFKSVKIRSFLDTPIMIWLGERSYSLFLIHFSVFYLVDYCCSLFIPDRNIYYGFFTRSIGIVLAFFCAILLFNFIERKQARGLITDKIFWPWNIKKLNNHIKE